MNSDEFNLYFFVSFTQTIITTIFLLRLRNSENFLFSDWMTLFELVRHLVVINFKALTILFLLSLTLMLLFLSLLYFEGVAQNGKMAFKAPLVPRELKYRILSTFPCKTSYKTQFYSLYYPFLGSTDVSGSNDSSTLIRDFRGCLITLHYDRDR